MKIIYTFLFSLPALAILDFLFIGVLMQSTYLKYMSPVVTVKFNIIYAFLFYIFYLAGIFFFVLYPNFPVYNLQKVILTGALFGFICYMTYDLVNLATVENWPLKLAIIDMLWGTFITATISAIAYQTYFYL